MKFQFFFSGFPVLLMAFALASFNVPVNTCSRISLAQNSTATGDVFGRSLTQPAAILRQDLETRKAASDKRELPSARFVVDKFIRAIGGYEILESRSTVHYKMSATKSDLPFEYEVYAADGMYYSCYHYENGRVFERGVNNGIAWTRTNGVVRQCEGEELAGLINRHRYIASAPRWFEMYQSIECQSIETINGHQTYKLHFVDGDGIELDRYFDTDTGLLIRSVADEVYNNGKRHIVRDYYDHKPMGEAVIAQRRSSNSAGTMYHYQVEEFEFDIKIPKGTFDLPAAIAARIARNAKDETNNRSDMEK